MKAGEVRKLLNSGFKTIMLNKLGFKKWKYGYVKETSNGTYYDFAFSYACYDTCFPTTFNYGIGLSQVTKIFKKIMPENFAGTEYEYPVILSLGQIGLFVSKRFPVLEYNIYSEEDINKMVSEVSAYFINEALPYLESISSIEKLEQITNNELNPHKRSTGLLLAKLVNNPNYENLKSQYRALIKDWPETSKQESEKVISFLDNHSQEELLKIAENPA